MPLQTINGALLINGSALVDSTVCCCQSDNPTAYFTAAPPDAPADDRPLATGDNNETQKWTNPLP
jgi:hypothetical protein